MAPPLASHTHLLLLLLGSLVEADEPRIGLVEVQLGKEAAEVVVLADLSQDPLQDHVLVHAEAILEDQHDVLLIGLWTGQKEAPSVNVSRGCSSPAVSDLRSPAQSYHLPPSSLLMLSCERRRTHSSSVVWKNKTGSFRAVHHSQPISSDDCRHTFSNVSCSAPEQPRTSFRTFPSLRSYVSLLCFPFNNMCTA